MTNDFCLHRHQIRIDQKYYIRFENRRKIFELNKKNIWIFNFDIKYFTLICFVIKSHVFFVTIKIIRNVFDKFFVERFRVFRWQIHDRKFLKIFICFTSKIDRYFRCFSHFVKFRLEFWQSTNISSFFFFSNSQQSRWMFWIVNNSRLHLNQIHIDQKFNNWFRKSLQKFRFKAKDIWIFNFFFVSTLNISCWFAISSKFKYFDLYRKMIFNFTFAFITTFLFHFFDFNFKYFANNLLCHQNCKYFYSFRKHEKNIFVFAFVLFARIFSIACQCSKMFWNFHLLFIKIDRHFRFISRFFKICIRINRINRISHIYSFFCFS